METLRIFVEPQKPFTNPLKYILEVFGKNKEVNIQFVDAKNESCIILSENANSHLPVACNFYEKISKNIFHPKEYFKNSCLIFTSEGLPDYLASAFYMINSLQEYYSENKDELGRFPYEKSYQFRFSDV